MFIVRQITYFPHDLIAEVYGKTRLNFDSDS